MANIFDYMDWRDISLEKVEFNEIDNLILARLSYFPFDGAIEENEIITIKEAYERYKKIDNGGKILISDDKKLEHYTQKSQERVNFFNYKERINEIIKIFKEKK